MRYGHVVLRSYSEEQDWSAWPEGVVELLRLSQEELEVRRSLGRYVGGVVERDSSVLVGVLVADDNANILDIVVHEEHRRRGLGRLLMNQYAWAVHTSDVVVEYARARMPLRCMQAVCVYREWTLEESTGIHFLVRIGFRSTRTRLQASIVDLLG